MIPGTTKVTVAVRRDCSAGPGDAGAHQFRASIKRKTPLSGGVFRFGSWRLERWVYSVDDDVPRATGAAGEALWLPCSQLTHPVSPLAKNSFFQIGSRFFISSMMYRQARKAASR